MPVTHRRQLDNYTIVREAEEGGERGRGEREGEGEGEGERGGRGGERGGERQHCFFKPSLMSLQISASLALSYFDPHTAVSH